jgi:hypothetical protein
MKQEKARGCPVVLAVWYAAIIFLLIIMFWNFTFLFRPQKTKYGLLLLIKDQEEAIEGILRAILWWRSLKGCWLEIVVIDCGSRDDTCRILERLNFPYPVCRVDYLPEGEEVALHQCLQGSYKFFTWDLRNQVPGRLWLKQISTCIGKNIKF